MAVPLRVGLIGAGSMGANHARVVAGSAQVELAVVVDPILERAQQLAAMHGGRASVDAQDALACDAVIIATATRAHAELALAAIAAGRAVLVEKPVSERYAETTAVVEAARNAGVPLMCGFVERFNAVIRTLQVMLDGPPAHVVSMRHSPHNPRATLSVSHDLLIHDVDIVLRLFTGRAVAELLGATWRPPGAPWAEVVDCTARFDDGTLASLSASRASQRKLRSMQVDTGNALYEVDLLRQDLTVYRHVGQAMSEDGGAYRAETIVDIPFVRHAGEPLSLQLGHFVALVESSNSGAIAEECDTILAPHRLVAELEEAAR